MAIKRFSSSSRMRRFARGGMSLVEVMIATAISATLLIAAFAAVKASADAVTNNDEFYRCTQSARVSLLQILHQARCTTGIADDGLGDHMELFTFDNKHLVFQYSPSTKQLLVIDETTPTSVTHVLAENISAATFAADMAPNPQTHVSSAVRVTVNLTVAVNQNTITLTGAAAPRINCHY